MEQTSRPKVGHRGGRGKRKDYESIQVRVPKELESKVRAMVEEWHKTHNQTTAKPSTNQTLEPDGIPF